MKRFVICLDGTWQQLRQEKLTNIGTIARSIAHSGPGPDGPVPQIVIYTQGVGSTVQALDDKRGAISKVSSRFAKLTGGIFGEGLEDQIVDTYLRLAFNFEAGDEIFIFGFSRGAFAARSLAGMISSVGIVSRRYAEQAWEAFRLYRARPSAEASDAEREAHDQSLPKFRRMYGKGRRDEQGARVATDDVPPINFLGIFDTVGQRGIPETFGAISRALNKRYGFHDMRLSPNVRAARHAVAIDEDRLGFPPTLWEGLDELNGGAGARRYEQRWFIGTHGDIGGGQGSPLSAAPLKWVTEGAAEAGLAFYTTDESPLLMALKEAGLGYDAPITRPSFWKGFSPMNYRFAQRRIWREKAQATREAAEITFHQTVVQRCVAKELRPRYQPAPLRPFQKALREWGKELGD
jgi:uncharacterized protein (DUF2235 family)